MNDLQVFNSPDFGELRTVDIDGEPWFVGKDVAEALGYQNPRDALAKHVDDEDKNSVAICDGTPGNPNLTIINESGVYSLIFSSKLEGAKKFKRWVTAEVLPAIRKQGGYLVPAAEQLAALVQAQTDMALAVQSLAQRMDALEQGNRELAALPAGDSGANSPPGLAAQRRWMRTVSEKLDLLSAKYSKSNNAVLHKIYQDMEEEFDTVLDDERYRVMEEQGLEKCSVLLAIFFDEELRDYFQRYIDYNLAPENRGW